MASWSPPECSSFGCQGRSKAEFGRLLGALGVLLVALGPLLGALLGPPGASWGAPGVHFGLPGVTFWSLFDFFLISPCEIVKTSKFVDNMALFEVFPGSEGSRIA